MLDMYLILVTTLSGLEAGLTLFQDIIFCDDRMGKVLRPSSLLRARFCHFVPRTLGKWKSKDFLP